ncbi:MAG TPA: biopolymer transporter ExbD [Steroidobacteraceae bacterium]|nr:biopolymer transporter ExbD [Steroidobacteraceae bacterium]
MTTLAEPQLNATPLIDVLLVLLVMLIFTLPVATHAVKLNLPHGVPGLPSAAITVNIDFDGQLYWNGESVSRRVLDQKLREAAAAMRPPRVKIVPDRRARYENVAQVLASAQRSGVTALEVQPVD